jgi:predicted membrane protein (TIGR00267 family)
VVEPEDENKRALQPKANPLEEGGLVERVMRSLELTKGVQIARRYLAMNGFDSALTMLGLLLGGLITIDPLNPTPGFNAILLAAAGTTIAMAVSGVSGSYLAESAEREREVEEMGRAMLTDMTDSMYAKASRTTAIVVAIVDGSSSAVAALIIMFPLWFVPFGLLTYDLAFYIAMAICMFLLFLLGLFLGHISKKSMWKYAARTLFAGIVTAALLYTIALLTGGG